MGTMAFRKTMLAALLSAAVTGCTAGAGTSPSPGPPTAGPTPTIVPTPTAEPPTWDYLVFGDSVMWGLQHAYAEALEEALGVHVNVLDETRGGGTATGLLRLLTSTDSSYAATLGRRISEAEIITIEIPLHEYESECGMDESSAEGTRECMTRAREQIVAATEGILAAVDRQARPEAMIRVIVDHLFFFDAFVEMRILDVASAQWRQTNDEIAAVASEHGMRVVSLWDALQGPDGTTDPNAAGLVVDGIHLSETGIERAVEALMAAGVDDAPPCGE